MPKVKIDEQIAADIYAALVGSTINRGDKVELELLAKTSFVAAEIFAAECQSRKPKFSLTNLVGD